MSREKIDRNHGILEMRNKHKKSFRQIANFFGINVKTVFDIYNRYNQKEAVDKVVKTKA